MRNTKSLFFTILLYMAVLVLSGCGAKIDGKININYDGSGSRTVICKISGNDINRIKGGEKSFDDIIIKNKPAALSFNKTLEGDNRLYKFTYNFKNFNDYMQKTQQITGKKPESNLNVTANGLNRNYSFYERNQTLDIMRWAIDEVERQGINGISLGEMYELGSTEVTLIGYKQYFEGDINITADKQFKMEKVNVETKIVSQGNISRNIQYAFSEETDKALNINNELIKFMEALVPKGARYQRVQRDSKVYYEINYSSGSINELNAKTHKATMDETSTFKINEVGDKSYSVITNNLADSISFNNITGGSSVREGINYILKLPVNFSIKKVLDYNPGTTGDKPQSFEMKNDTDSRTINYPVEGNSLKFTLEYTVPRANSYFLIWTLGTLILAMIGLLIVRYIMKVRSHRGIIGPVKEDTLSLDKEWKIELNKRLKDKDIE